MIVNNLPDITGDGTTHPLVDDTATGKFVLVKTDEANSATPVRVGGPQTSANRGIPLPPGSSLTFPTISDPMEMYPLAKIFYNAANGDKIYVEYGVEGSAV